MKKEIVIDPDCSGRSEKRWKIFLVSRELIEQLLLLPSNARIIDVSSQVRFDSDLFAFKVECPDFEHVEPGQALGVCDPQYELRNGAAFFTGWGVE
jgi:hypothetical protein